MILMAQWRTICVNHSVDREADQGNTVPRDGTVTRCRPVSSGLESLAIVFVAVSSVIRCHVVVALVLPRCGHYLDEEA